MWRIYFYFFNFQFNHLAISSVIALNLSDHTEVTSLPPSFITWAWQNLGVSRLFHTKKRKYTCNRNIAHMNKFQKDRTQANLRYRVWKIQNTSTEIKWNNDDVSKYTNLVPLQICGKSNKQRSCTCVANTGLSLRLSVSDHHQSSISSTCEMNND